MISSLIAQIKTADALKLVAGAADFEAAAESRPAVLPAAYVLPLNVTPGENESLEGVTQRVTSSFGIALALSNVADPKGRAALDSLGAVRTAVSAVVLGWVPDGYEAPFIFGGGALLGFKKGVLWWQDVYAIEHLIDDG